MGSDQQLVSLHCLQGFSALKLLYCQDGKTATYVRCLELAWRPLFFPFTFVRSVLDPSCTINSFSIRSMAISPDLSPAESSSEEELDKDEQRESKRRRVQFEDAAQSNKEVPA